MYKKFEMELAGRTLRVDVDRVAKQANGAVLMHYGDTTVLCTATASEKPRRGLLAYLKKTDIERYRALIEKLGLRK